MKLGVWDFVIAFGEAGDEDDGFLELGKGCVVKVKFLSFDVK